MRFLGLEIAPARRETDLSIDEVIKRFAATMMAGSGVSVTPETAMRAPTVHAIVTVISRRIASMPVHVMRKTTDGRRERKERLPDHPAAKLLNRPNEWQDRVTFMMDAASRLVRYGNFYAYAARGKSGPPRRMLPFHPAQMRVTQDEDWRVTYEYRGARGEVTAYRPDQIIHARTASRDGLVGDAPVDDLREAIALEIAAEQMGATIFGNLAAPGMLFTASAGSKGFRSDEAQEKFIESFQRKFSNRRGRFLAMFLPKGVEKVGESGAVENDKAQFIQTRQHQRTVIAGGFGFPPWLVGDLTAGKYNNVEQQQTEVITGVCLPYVRVLEAAFEHALLSDEDRANGVIIRFNLDALIRADFKSRQEGLKIQREAGVINPNDWREREGMNPISEEDGGEGYWRQGPSGQSASAEGDDASAEDDDQNDDNEKGASRLRVVT